MRKRGFEILDDYKDKGIRLPSRKTSKSCGYDIEAAKDMTIAPHCLELVPTGLCAYMQDDEYLGLHVRSSIAVKYKVALINCEGVIDADYYGNPDNGGHLMLPLYNHGDKPFYIEKGMRVAQGVFYKYLTVDDDDAHEERKGGFGSTGAC